MLITNTKSSTKTKSSKKYLADKKAESKLEYSTPSFATQKTTEKADPSLITLPEKKEEVKAVYTPKSTYSGGGQCNATTKKGAQCKRTARSGGYCWQHGG